MRVVALGCLCLTLLAGCATVPVSREPLSVADEAQLLGGLAGFALDGRAAVKAGEEGFNATLAWRQRSAETQLKLSGPLGAGSLTLLYGPEVLRVTTSRGEDLQGAEAEEALRAQLGFVPPFEALRYWVLGLAAPGEPPTDAIADDSGRVTAMTQQDWRISYERWTEVALKSGIARLPQRLTATRGDLRLRLVVDRWKL